MVYRRLLDIRQTWRQTAGSPDDCCAVIFRLARIGWNIRLLRTGAEEVANRKGVAMTFHLSHLITVISF